MFKTIGIIAWIGSIIAFCLPLQAWNDDYLPDYFPAQRTVCAKNLSGISRGSTAQLHSQAPDEACSPQEIRYTLVVGTNPKGSVALLPLKFYDELYPPWVVSWPPRDDLYSPRLWHFTCFSVTSKDVLGTATKNRHYRGEITSPSDQQSCEAAAVMARTVCTENLGGSEILEQCSGGINLFDE